MKLALASCAVLFGSLTLSELSGAAAPPATSALHPVALEELELARMNAIEDAEHLPQPVLDKLADIDASARAVPAHPSYGDPHWNPELLRVNLPRPGRGPLQIFASREPTRATMHEMRILFAYDPRTRQVSSEEFRMDGHWLGEEGLHLRRADLDRDGQDELVFRDFLHNGTVTNIDQAVFLQVDDDLALREVLRFHLRVRDIHSRGEAGAIRARLLHAGENELLLERWSENPHYGDRWDVLEPERLLRDPSTGRWR